MNALLNWLSVNYLEIFGAVTGVLYVFLEIRQDVRLWPVGIVTSSVYLWVFFVNQFYADAGLQCYYLIVSLLGWFWWRQSRSSYKSESVDDKAIRDVGKSLKEELVVSHITLKMAIILLGVFVVFYLIVWQLLSRFTDSPVAAADTFISTLSAIATWMLARKIIEHWYLWLIINIFASVLFFTRGLYPTALLYVVYLVMAVIGLKTWRKSLKDK